MGEEVISYKETQKHEVIDDSFQIEPELYLNTPEFQIQQLSISEQLHELKVYFYLLTRRVLSLLHFLVLDLFGTLSVEMSIRPTQSALLVISSKDRLSDYIEPRLMCCQPQHNQIGICSINAVSNIRVVVRLCSLQSQELQYFMLPLSRYSPVTENDFDTFEMDIM